MSIKFTQLPPPDPLTGTEILCMVQGGLSKQVTAAALAGAVVASGLLDAVIPAGTTNNWAPVGFNSGVRVLNVDTTAGAAVLTGLVGGIDGQRLVIRCKGPNTLTVNKLDGGSAAAVQFDNVANIGVLSHSAIEVMYIAGTVNKWQVVS